MFRDSKRLHLYVVIFFLLPYIVVASGGGNQAKKQNTNCQKSKDLSLPTVFLIGASFGIANLYEILISHPQLCGGSKKETRFFSTRGEVPSCTQFLDMYTDKKCDTRTNSSRFVEATPIMHQCGSFKSIFDFFSNDDTIPPIYQDISKLRFISVLREPVERDISYFLFAATHISRVRNGKSIPLIDVRERPFEVTKSDESVFSLPKMLCDMSDFTDTQNESKKKKKSNFESMVEAEVTFHKLFRGKYVVQLREYEKYFSRSQLLVLNSAELLRQPDVALKKIQTFLDLNTSWPIGTKFQWMQHPVDLPNINVNISCTQMKKLIDLYGPWNQELYEWDKSFEKFKFNKSLSCI